MTSPSTLSPDPAGRRAWWIVLALLGLVYALGVNDAWAISADGSLYLALGRSLAEGRGMAYGGRQWWTIPPMLPALVAACRLLVGRHFWLLNAALSAAGLASAAWVSRVAARRDGERMAAAVLAVAGFSAYLYATSARIHTDALFAALVAGAIWALARPGRMSPGWAAVGAALVTAAIFTRLVGVVLAGGVFVGLILKWRQAGRQRGAWIMVAAGGAAVVAATVAWLVWVRPRADAGVGDYLTVIPGWLARLAEATYWAGLLRAAGRAPGAVFGAITGQNAPLWAAAAPAALVVWGLVAMARRGAWVVVCAAGLYVAFLVVYTEGAVARRYILPVMPILVWALLVGAREAAARLRRRRPERARRAALWTTAAVCLGISLPKLAREVVWLRHPDFYRVYEKGEWAAVVAAGAWLRDHADPARDTLASHEATVLHVLTHLELCAPDLPQGTSGPWERYQMTPSVYASTVEASGGRFAVLPRGGSWDEVAAHLEASGAFRPAASLGEIVIYVRTDGRASPVP